MKPLTKEQKEYLTPLIPEVDTLAQKESDEELLQTIDELILNEYDQEQESLSLKGIKLQSIYDEIFEMND